MPPKRTQRSGLSESHPGLPTWEKLAYDYNTYARKLGMSSVTPESISVLDKLVFVDKLRGMKDEIREKEVAEAQERERLKAEKEERKEAEKKEKEMKRLAEKEKRLKEKVLKEKEELDLKMEEVVGKMESLGLEIDNKAVKEIAKRSLSDSAMYGAHIPFSPPTSPIFGRAPITTIAPPKVIEDEYTKRRRLQQERIDKLKLDLYANENVPQMKDQYGQWIERPPEYLPENVPSRSLTRAGANMMGISRRNLRGEWDVKNLQRMKIPLRVN